jgi:hypothetical protein
LRPSASWRRAWALAEAGRRARADAGDIAP